MINMRFADWCHNSPGRSALSWTGSWDSGPSQRLSLGRRSRVYHHSFQHCLEWGVRGWMWDLWRRKKRRSEHEQLFSSCCSDTRDASKCSDWKGVYQVKSKGPKPVRMYKSSNQASCGLWTSKEYAWGSNWASMKMLLIIYSNMAVSELMRGMPIFIQWKKNKTHQVWCHNHSEQVKKLYTLLH